jgi:hypothetical protein
MKVIPHKTKMAPPVASTEKPSAGLTKIEIQGLGQTRV